MIEEGYGALLGHCTCLLDKDLLVVVLLIMICLTAIHSCDIITDVRVVVNHGCKYVRIIITCMISSMSVG